MSGSDPSGNDAPVAIPTGPLDLDIAMLESEPWTGPDAALAPAVELDDDSVPPESAIAASQPPAEPSPPLFTVSIGMLAWIGVAAAFIGLRIGPIWQAPVGGSELIHLSGAWQASIGIDDDRFIATFFQAFAAILLRMSDSEVGPRILATLATLTIPIAVYRLRGVLTEAGALLALGILALDAPGILAGTSASAMGFDLAIAAWGFALIAGAVPRHSITLVVAGFLAATAGPIVLPLVVALGLQLAYRRRAPRQNEVAFVVAGTLAGLLVSLLRYGSGVGSAPFPSIQLFVDSFDQPWATANGIQVLLLYCVPQVLGGIAAAAWWLTRHDEERPSDAIVFSLLWAGVAAAWVVVSLNAHSPVAAAALGLPLALIAGPALAAGLNAMLRADWSAGRFMLPLAGLATLVAGNYVIDWARFERLGSAHDKIIVTGMLLAAGVALAPLFWYRWMRPVLLAPALALAAVPVLASAFGVGLSANPEPLLSPNSTGQARVLRDEALREAEERGGRVVIHPSLEKEMTWAFRKSGTLLIASPAPPEAAILLWPVDLPRPEGFVPLEGEWALTENVQIPTDTFLDYLHWMIDGNSLVVTPDRIAVFARTTE